MPLFKEWIRQWALFRQGGVTTILLMVAILILSAIVIFVPDLRWLSVAILGAMGLHNWAQFHAQQDSFDQVFWDYVTVIYDSILMSWAFYLFYDLFAFAFALYFLVILLGAWVRKLEGGTLAATLSFIGYNLVVFFQEQRLQLLDSLFIALLFGVTGLVAGLLSQQEEAAKEALATERERARVRAERIGALEVGRVLTSTLDLNQVLQLIMQRITRTLDAEAGSILLVEEGDTLAFRVAQGEMAETISSLRLKIGQGIAGWVAQEGRPLLVPSVEKDNRFYPGIDALSHFHTRSILCVPLKSRDRIIGVIEVINKRTANFSEDDLYWLNMVASSAAIAIENAQLYEQLQAQVVALEQANSELRNTQAQLVQSAKLASIGQLAAGVAHEINNPLSVILGFAETIPKLGKVDEAVEQPLATIRREALRCRRIIKQLLDFSSQSSISLKPVDLNELLDRTLPLLQYQSALKGIDIRRDYDPDLPTVMVDSDQLQQVFVNLLLNAGQAMPKGGDLTLRTGADKAQVWASVVDTGVGIPPDDLERIFDPFFSTKGVGEGTGLGLAVSYGIIEKHGGTIQVESEPGQGSTFTILLPLPKGEGSKEPLETSNTAKEAP